MKALAYGLALAALLPAIAQAQIKIDTNLVTCAQYLAMPPDQAANFAASSPGNIARSDSRTSRSHIFSPA